MRGGAGEPPESSAGPPTGPERGASSEVGAEAMATAEAPLPAFTALDDIASGRAPAEERAALEAYEELSRTMGEATAIAQAKRALAVAPLPGLRIRVARTLDARGDDEGVESVLSRLSEGPEVPEALLLEAWMRRAEVRERSGDVQGACTLYERILARDVGYPRAKARLAQLSSGGARERATGATVMAEGALTRGRYRVVQELGRGGAGTVFLAEDVGLARQVALKVYHRRGRADRERLLHEARMPAELEHPGVVRILDVDVELFAIAMEVTSGSVKDAGRGGELARDRVIGWGRSIVGTLGWLHAHGVVHRDLKPSNFLLRRERVVLTDFGLATRIGAPGTGATAGGEGTAGYMPPEQRRGEPATPAMDVHALGVSLEEMMSWTVAGWPLAERPSALVALLGAMRAPEAAARPDLAAVRAVLEQLG